jgi:hypothetical protein
VLRLADLLSVCGFTRSPQNTRLGVAASPADGDELLALLLITSLMSATRRTLHADIMP